MSNLEWRTATDVVLNDKLIPNPNAAHELLDKLRNVLVAIEGSFLHIDPRQAADREAGKGQEFDVTVVPAAAVHAITYRDVQRRGRVAGF